MDLHSGLPYWIVRDPLNNYYNPLIRDHYIDVAIVGSGITGALVAHELCRAGIKCCVIDKLTLCTGSSAASTALLQYEIDTPLCRLMGMVGEEPAVQAYMACLQSIRDVENVLKELDINASFEKASNVFYGSDRSGLGLVMEEFQLRKRYDLPVSFLDNWELAGRFNIGAYGALANDVSAQMDPYAAAQGILRHYLRKGDLEIFTHTEISRWTPTENGYRLMSRDGHTIRCQYVVVAAGFEAGKFLPEEVMELTSTYAIISQPVEERILWPEKCLIWETGNPYLYIRTADNNRIIVGGEDIPFKNEKLRDRLLNKKTEKLEKKFNKLFPEIPFKTELCWCGTFSSTKDGLPFIGAWPGNERMLFALGYGGNGITFSMIAAQILGKKIQGHTDERERIFGFERLKKA